MNKARYRLGNAFERDLGRSRTAQCPSAQPRHIHRLENRRMNSFVHKTGSTGSVSWMREGRALPERLRAVVELGIRIQRAEREFVTNSAIVVDLASRFCVLVRKLCAAQIRIRRSSLGEGAADVAALVSFMTLATGSSLTRNCFLVFWLCLPVQ